MSVAVVAHRDWSMDHKKRRMTVADTDSVFSLQWVGRAIHKEVHP